jgi:oligopeptide transport system substrate-binding protein
MKARNTSLGRGEAPGATRISRRDFLKIGGTGLAGATLLGAVPGCGVFEQGGAQQGGGGVGDSIAVNVANPIKDLNSTTTTDSASTSILDQVMEGLHRLDPDNKPVPAQAESVQISDDGLNYTFTLRDGLKWSNGDPVTSHDFKYAWLTALDPDTASIYAYIISTFVKGADEFNTGKGSAEDVAVETPDDKTLKVTLLAPSPYWLGLMSFFTYYPQNQKFVEQQGNEYAKSPDTLLYNGPFVMTEFNPTEGATLEKNDMYWDKGNVGLQKVELDIVKEIDTAVNLYESGQLDAQEITSEYVTEYRGKPDFYTQTLFVTWWSQYNLKVPILQNENIRRALQIGFDRKALVNKLLNNGSEPATGYVPDGIAGPGNQTFREARGPVLPEYDLQKAKELWQKGVEEVGENPTIEYLSYDTSLSRDINTFLQSEYEKMGAKIEVNVQPYNRALELQETGDYQITQYGWIGDYDDPMTFLDLWLSDSSFNTGHYKNPRYDELVTGAQEETDLKKRMDMLLEAERILVEEDAAMAPQYFEGEAWLIRPALQESYVDHPYGGGWDMKWWKTEG